MGVKRAMAERGAHLTLTSHAKPSIFEVIAQDSLSVTFHPAMKRVATVKKNQLINIISFLDCGDENYASEKGSFPT